MGVLSYKSQSLDTSAKLTVGPVQRNVSNLYEFLTKIYMYSFFVSFLQYHHAGKTACFYLNEKRTADAVRQVSRRITLPNGFKVRIASPRLMRIFLNWI